MTKSSKTSPPISPSAAGSASPSPDSPPIKRRGPNKVRRKDAFTPTDKQRAQVEVLAAAGVSHGIIADMIGCPSDRTLRTYFEKELRLGGPKLVSMAVNVIAAALTRDNVPWPDKLRAAIYVTKARGDWRERDVVEHTGKDGGPILTKDVSKLTDEQLDAIEKILAAPGGADQSGTAGDPASGEGPTRH